MFLAEVVLIQINILKLYLRIVILFTLFLVSFTSLATAQTTGSGGATAPTLSNTSAGGGGGASNESNYTAEYDPEILDAFDNKTWVSVLVRLADNSNITITGTKEERRAISRQRDEWFKPVIDEVLATLSETEFKLSSKRFDGFSGEITKEGFTKLLKDERVGVIHQTLKSDAFAVEKNLSVAEKDEVSEPGIERKSGAKNYLLWVYIILALVISTVIIFSRMQNKK